MSYIIKFKAYTEENYGKEWLVWKKLITKEISVEINSELAEKSNKFDDTNYIVVDISPTIFEKFIITKTGLNYTAQTIDVPRLLECWEALKFRYYIDTNTFNFYKGWATSFDVDGIPKNL